MDTITYSASDARQNLFTLIKKAAKGLTAVEINLRNSEPVVMVNKAEVESWLESLDILSSPEEISAVRAGRKSRKLVPMTKVYGDFL